MISGETVVVCQWRGLRSPVILSLSVSGEGTEAHRARSVSVWTLALSKLPTAPPNLCCQPGVHTGTRP